MSMRQNGGQNGGQRDGFNRPLPKTIINEVTQATGLMIEAMDMGDSCPHKVMRASNGSEFVFESALTPIKDDSGKIKTFVKEYPFAGKTVTETYSLYRCSECGKVRLIMTDVDYISYLKNLKSAVDMLVDNFPTELYYRSSKQFGETVGSSGDGMLLSMLQSHGDIYRYSRMQYAAYNKEYSNTLGAMIQELEQGVVADSTGITPEAVTRRLQVGTPESIKYDLLGGSAPTGPVLTPVTPQTTFTQEGGYTPPVKDSVSKPAPTLKVGD